MSELSNKIFNGDCKFTAAVSQSDEMIASYLPEVAFIGYSNVGKSSLLNAIFRRKTMARTSQTPGCTQTINFYNIGSIFHAVDLPGYGYARASKQALKQWRELIYDYLGSRNQLRKVYILIDARRGIREFDEDISQFMDGIGMAYQIILTKLDKVKSQEFAIVYKKLEEWVVRRPACFNEIIPTSAQKKQGVAEVQQNIIHLLLPQNS